MHSGTARAASWASSEAARRTMVANRSRDTAPEMRLRRAVHAMGLRYRVCRPPIPGVRRTGDLVFSRVRIVVFVDGCFWHGCAEHFQMPVANRGYWEPKISANRERDANTDALLQRAGWHSIRVWEHADVTAAAEGIAVLVRGVLETRKKPGNA